MFWSTSMSIRTIPFILYLDSGWWSNGRSKVRWIGEWNDLREDSHCYRPFNNFIINTCSDPWHIKGNADSRNIVINTTIIIVFSLLWRQTAPISSYEHHYLYLFLIALLGRSCTSLLAAVKSNEPSSGEPSVSLHLSHTGRCTVVSCVHAFLIFHVFFMFSLSSSVCVFCTRFVICCVAHSLTGVSLLQRDCPRVAATWDRWTRQLKHNSLCNKTKCMHGLMWSFYINSSTISRHLIREIKSAIPLGAKGKLFLSPFATPPVWQPLPSEKKEILPCNFGQHGSNKTSLGTETSREAHVARRLLSYVHVSVCVPFREAVSVTVWKPC